MLSSEPGSLKWDGPPNNRVNLTVRPVTAIANDAIAAPIRPAGYAER